MKYNPNKLKITWRDMELKPFKIEPIPQKEIDKFEKDIIRSNNMSNLENREYQDHEFCKAINCKYFFEDEDKCIYHCQYTAKEFHQWLKENNFKLIKKFSTGNKKKKENNLFKFKRYDVIKFEDFNRGRPTITASNLKGIEENNTGKYVEYNDVNKLLKEIRSTIFNKFYTNYLSDFLCKKELLEKLDNIIEEKK